jgi:molybdate transport system substrate-binding protein
MTMKNELRKNSVTRLACTFFLILGLFACDKPMNSVSNKPADTGDKPKLLIYCGITMIKAMSEIARIIEQQENCHITITKGGSGNLIKSILYNQIGDLYLPGSEKYFSIISKDHPGLVTEAVTIGENKAVLMVQRGNPKNIPLVLESLADPAYAVMIGNPDSGSIGKETRQILERKGIYEAVVKNTMAMTTDSKDLVKVIKNRKADMVVNWYAAATWDDNADHIQTAPIDPQYAKGKKLVLGLLQFSRQPELAKKLMAFSASEQGADIFRTYGLKFD